MSKVNPEEQQQSIVEVVQEVIKQNVSIVMSGVPVFIAGVNRKAYIGNFETIDVYGAIAIPMPQAASCDPATVQDIAMETAALGFGIASSETFKRYQKIKNSTEED